MDDHGDETVAAWLLDPEGGVSPFGEALLSTQYDDAAGSRRARASSCGRQEDDAPPMRAAGTRLGARPRAAGGR